MVNLKESGCESQELTSSSSQIWLVLLEGWSWVQKKILPFWVLHPSDATGKEVHSNFPGSINSNPRIHQNLPRDHHSGYTPNLSTHQRSTEKPQSTKKKQTSISHDLNFHQKNKQLQIQLVELPKTLRLLFDQGPSWSFSFCCDVARIVNASSSRWYQIKKASQRSTAPPIHQPRWLVLLIKIPYCACGARFFCSYSDRAFYGSWVFWWLHQSLNLQKWRSAFWLRPLSKKSKMNLYITFWAPVSLSPTLWLFPSLLFISACCRMFDF